MRTLGTHAPMAPDRRIHGLVATRRLFGLLLMLNFAVFWVAPILIQVLLFQIGLHRIVRPVFSLLDRSAALRCFASRYVWGTSIFEIAVLLQTGRIDRLIDRHYADFSGTLDRDELVELFSRRARRREMSYEDYEFRYLPGLRDKMRNLVGERFKNEKRAYIFQAHHKFDAGFSDWTPRWPKTFT